MKKITTCYEQQEPFEGNRSPSYFGIALFLERDFFDVTRDMKAGSPRPDPRIKLFDRGGQKKLRDRILVAASQFGVDGETATSEWEKIVKGATSSATEHISLQTEAGKTKASPLILRKHAAIVVEAYRVACRFAGGLVYERETIQSSWPSQGSFDLSVDTQTFIYIRKDNPKNDLYKIGKTKRRAERHSAYGTHSAESQLLAEYPEAGALTEAAIHQYFSSQRSHREFFRLSDDDVQLVISERAMRRAISNLQPDQ